MDDSVPSVKRALFYLLFYKRFSTSYLCYKEITSVISSISVKHFRKFCPNVFTLICASYHLFSSYEDNSFADIGNSALIAPAVNSAFGNTDVMQF